MRTLLIIVAFSFCVFSAFADDSVDAQARELFETVMSPYCPGRTLSACPSDDARVLRDQIRESLVKGKTPETIRSELLEYYGSQISGKPAGEHSSSFGYTIPLIVLLIGGIIVTYAIRHGRKNRNRVSSKESIEPSSSKPIEEELMRRIRGEGE